MCNPPASPVVQTAGPLFCAARQPVDNSCFSFGNTALQPARPPALRLVLSVCTLVCLFVIHWWLFSCLIIWVLLDCSVATAERNEVVSLPVDSSVIYFSHFYVILYIGLVLTFHLDLHNLGFLFIFQSYRYW